MEGVPVGTAPHPVPGDNPEQCLQYIGVYYESMLRWYDTMIKYHPESKEHYMLARLKFEQTGFYKEAASYFKFKAEEYDKL